MLSTNIMRLASYSIVVCAAWRSFPQLLKQLVNGSEDVTQVLRLCGNVFVDRYTQNDHGNNCRHSFQE